MTEKKFPKISIVTPSFNQGGFLEQTIRSVLDQNYPDLEYIIIDGGSTDNSVEIIKKYEKHLSYWVSEKDSGQSEAINKGIARCTGDVFNWLNSDDFFSPGLLHEVGSLFASGADVVTGKIRIHYPDGSSVLTAEFPPSPDLARTVASNVYVQQCTFFKTQFMKQVHGVNPILHYSMDLELWLKYLLMNGLSGVRYNEKIIGDFRIHDTSKTFLSDNNFFNDWIKIYVSIRSIYDSSIKDRFSKILGDYKFNIEKINVEEKIVRKALSMFFYDASITLYGRRKFDLFDMIVSLMELDYLDPKSVLELKKMKRRRRFIPKWLYGISEKK